VDVELAEEVRSLMAALDSNEEASDIVNGPDPRLGRGEDIIETLTPEIHPGMTDINVLPSTTPGPCESILLVAIGFRDSVERMIVEAIKQISECQKQKRPNKFILFYAANWNFRAWSEHMNWFKKNTRGVWLKTPGGRWSPLP
jgi:hypothetical protein